MAMTDDGRLVRSLAAAIAGKRRETACLPSFAPLSPWVGVSSNASKVGKTDADGFGYLLLLVLDQRSFGADRKRLDPAAFIQRAGVQASFSAPVASGRSSGCQAMESAFTA
ncbi:hypothetical protein [Pararhodobacter oceanensis]|uniref:hypothetical protein n=1 Tax=Pararhodobacter oceanensis TaxID=2172121 RepID=UPI003A91BD74